MDQLTTTDIIVDDFTPIAQAAETYVSLSLAPVPLYGLRPDGRCQCGSLNCHAAGKHPVGTEWQKRATTDLDKVRDRFRDHQGNIGIALLGRYVLIDADGTEGIETTKQFGDMPDTLVQVSGSQTGAHWIYRLAPHQSADKITDRRVAPGVDVKIRGQFVAAPSMHASGNRYRWERLREPAELPDHLYRLICKPEVTPVTRIVRPAGGNYNRVRAYIAKMPSAVAGSGGHSQTYAVACRIASEGLTPDEEWDIFTEYNARCEPPWSTGELTHKLNDARAKRTNEPLPDRPRPSLSSVPIDATVDDSWKQLLLYESTKSGDARVARCAENAAIILLHDPAWAGRVRYDEFTQHVSLTDPPWSDYIRSARAAHQWTDSDTTRLQGWFERAYSLRLPVADLDRAVAVVAEKSAHSSARDWFESLEWDGVPRVGKWLSLYLGAADDAYTNRVGGWWLVSAVARVYQPGCKADHMLILYGDQGVGKSSAANILAGPDWFSDSPVPIGNKDAYLALQGRLIVEMAELESMNRAETSAIKSFLTSRTDNFRPPFARRNVDVPRQCVFLGTTNHPEMLRDGTGDRRFWPVTVGTADRDLLARDREQIWAETVHAYKQGARWYPVTAEERALCTYAQDEHKARHPWESRIETWAEGKEGIQIADIMQHALNIPTGQWRKQDVEVVTECLRRMKWKYTNDARLTGKRCRYFRRTE
jgi:predicted P-loop ATPase